MKKITILFAIYTLLVTSVYAQTKQVDAELSDLTWVGEKVTGKHTGKIAIKSASLEMKGEKLVGGQFIIDMNSITCTDIENEDYNAKLVGHLKSDDFFGVAKHPISKLQITKVKQQGDAYIIDGDLTIKGKKHPINFKAQNSGNALTGKLVIDRAKYDVRYGSGQFFDNLGDKMIYDDFSLEFKVVVMK